MPLLHIIYLCDFPQMLSEAEVSPAGKSTNPNKTCKANFENPKASV